MDSTNGARMPAAFLGHGSPMNALEANRFTEAWRAFGEATPTPRAILCVSAHWYVPMTAVTAMARPRTIHDFFGFPEALFEVSYPAPGDPSVAEEVRDVVKPTHVGLDADSWGIDHGAWSVLVHAFPKADIPVLQLSIDARKPMAYHLDLGAKLSALRDRGILVIASGNVVHNLRLLVWSEPNHAFDWAERFGETAGTLLTERPGDVEELEHHPDFARSVPTPEHFLPLVYLAGLARAAESPLQLMIDGYAMGSLSMACYGLDAARPPEGDRRPAASVPDPLDVPPEDTNL